MVHLKNSKGTAHLFHTSIYSKPRVLLLLSTISRLFRLPTIRVDFEERSVVDVRSAVRVSHFGRSNRSHLKSLVNLVISIVAMKRMNDFRFSLDRYCFTKIVIQNDRHERTQSGPRCIFDGRNSNANEML